MLEIERELSQIREEIEAKQGRLKYLQSQVSLSTLEIEFYKDEVTTQVTNSYGSKMVNALKSGWNGVSVFFLGLLHLWPFLILLGIGAFFMRRTFKGNKLYAAVFDEYLHSVFSNGYSTEYFVEGGRSRTGRTLNPKAGMLAMTLRSYLRDSRKPIIFMPVYVGYEKVFESSSYQGELKGKKKKKPKPKKPAETKTK